MSVFSGGPGNTARLPELIPAGPRGQAKKILDTENSYPFVGASLVLHSGTQVDGLISDLSKYYRKNRMRLATAVFAALSAAIIQIKYWIYYNHDCLKLNPYGIRHHHKRSLTLRQSHEQERCRRQKSALRLPSQRLQETEEHDHDHCNLCQTFQQLTEAVFEPPFAPELQGQLQDIRTEAQTESLLLSFSHNHSTAPRAPPCA